MARSPSSTGRAGRLRQHIKGHASPVPTDRRRYNSRLAITLVIACSATGILSPFILRLMPFDLRHRAHVLPPRSSTGTWAWDPRPSGAKNMLRVPSNKRHSAVALLSLVNFLRHLGIHSRLNPFFLRHLGGNRRLGAGDER
jgi:hypothetical protein